MAEQPTPQPTPGLPGHAETHAHEALTHVLDQLRTASRHRDDMQSEVYVRLSEADAAAMVTALEHVAQQWSQKSSDIKK